MDATSFREVFNLATAPDRWLTFLPLMILIPGVALALAIMPKRYHDILDKLPMQGLTGAARRVLALLVFVFSSLVLGIAGYDHVRQMHNDLAIPQSGNLRHVEGCLQGFHPMSVDAHDHERILVNGTGFSYSDFDESTPGFNTTSAHGGPIQADSAVRIDYIGNTIVKLAVRDHACPHAPDLPG